MKGGGKVGDTRSLDAIPGYSRPSTVSGDSLSQKEGTFHSTASGSVPSRITFPDVQEERVYQQYLRKVRYDALAVLLVLSMLFDVYGICMSVVMYHSSRVASLVVSCLAIVINVVLFILLKRRVFPDWFFKYFPYLLWIWLGSQILMEMELNRDVVSPRESLGFVMLFLYSTYVMLPVQWAACLTLSILGASLHVLMVTLLPVVQDYSDAFPMMGKMVSDLILFIIYH